MDSDGETDVPPPSPSHRHQCQRRRQWTFHPPAPPYKSDVNHSGKQPKGDLVHTVATPLNGHQEEPPQTGRREERRPTPIAGWVAAGLGRMTGVRLWVGGAEASVGGGRSGDGSGRGGSGKDSILLGNWTKSEIKV
jgi:hypothetical protein